ncbi:HAD family hydrolase [Comamonadaceae bacterium PP-2]
MVGSRALFLDRDGVINVDSGYVHRIEEFRFLPGIFELVRQANACEYRVVVVTNQAGIGRGYYTEVDFRVLMDWVREQFVLQGAVLDAVYFCPDHPEHGVGRYRRQSPMRKPGPGMLLQAQQDLGLDLSRSIMVGDSLSDMQAGRAAGVPVNLLLNADVKSGEDHTLITHLADVRPYLAPPAVGKAR